MEGRTGTGELERHLERHSRREADHHVAKWALTSGATAYAMNFGISAMAATTQFFIEEDLPRMIPLGLEAAVSLGFYGVASARRMAIRSDVYHYRVISAHHFGWAMSSGLTYCALSAVVRAAEFTLS